MLRVVSARCVVCDLHTIAPDHSIRIGDGSRHSEEIVKKSRTAPSNVIIIIINSYSGTKSECLKPALLSHNNPPHVFAVIKTSIVIT